MGASLVAQLVKKSTCNAGDLGSIPGLGRSPGEGKGYPLQYGEFHGLYSSLGPGGQVQLLMCIMLVIAEEARQ